MSQIDPISSQIDPISNMERNAKYLNIAENAGKALLVAGIATLAFSIGIYYTSAVASNWMFSGSFWYVDTSFFAKMIASEAGASAFLSAGISTSLTGSAFAFLAHMQKRSVEQNMELKRLFIQQ